MESELKEKKQGECEPEAVDLIPIYGTANVQQLSRIPKDQDIGRSRTSGKPLVSS